MIDFANVKTITDSSGVSVAKILDSSGNALWTKPVDKAVVNTSATSGVTYTSGISDLDATTIDCFSEAISNNGAITKTTSTVYVDYGSLHRKVSVGDQISISLDGTDYTFDLIGFNHDTLTSTTAYGTSTTTGKAGMTFQMHDLFATAYVMNTESTNVGGWKSSIMRTSTMPIMKGYLPSGWQNAIKTVNKLSGIGGEFSSGVETTSDDCFLLAEIEVFNTTEYSAAGEGSQYAWYTAGNSTLKTGIDKPNWWLRSPVPDDTYVRSFARVSASAGSITKYRAESEYGVSFAFCI